MIVQLNDMLDIILAVGEVEDKSVENWGALPCKLSPSVWDSVSSKVIFSSLILHLSIADPVTLQ